MQIMDQMDYHCLPSGLDKTLDCRTQECNNPILAQDNHLGNKLILEPYHLGIKLILERYPLDNKLIQARDHLLDLEHQR